MKSNKETLEEAADKYAESKSRNFKTTHVRDFTAGAKWQKERMYSEEEVCEFIEWINLHYRDLEHTLSFKDAKNTKDLLKQFKKK